MFVKEFQIQEALANHPFRVLKTMIQFLLEGFAGEVSNILHKEIGSFHNFSA